VRLSAGWKNDTTRMAVGGEEGEKRSALFPSSGPSHVHLIQTTEYENMMKADSGALSAVKLREEWIAKKLRVRFWRGRGRRVPSVHL
jgi:hypothetical protein